MKLWEIILLVVVVIGGYAIRGFLFDDVRGRITGRGKPPRRKKRD